MDLNSRHLIWREGRGNSHAQGSEVSGRVDVVCICMSVCLPVTAVPPLTEYSTNGMHEGRAGKRERDVLQTLARCISMSTWRWGGEEQEFFFEA